MECPHCMVAIAPVFHSTVVYPTIYDKAGKYCSIYSAICPACEERMIYSIFVKDWSRIRPRDPISSREFQKIQDALLLFPKSKKPKQFPSDSGVPHEYVKDYEEAYAVLEISPKASAALSRRLLQRLLRDKGIRPRNIDEEIKDAIETQGFTSDIQEVINNVKIIGKYAAHPNMTTAGQIIDIEPEEAQWSLYVLELLFDFYFVQREKARRMRNALNAKANNPKKYSKKNNSGSATSNPP